MRVQLLSALELFMPLTDEERLALAVELTPSPFVAGDIATRQGNRPTRSTFWRVGMSASFTTSRTGHSRGASAWRHCMDRRISGRWAS